MNYPEHYAANSWIELSKQGQDAPEEVADQRYEICKTCPLFDKINLLCYSCGCYMPTQVKYSTNSCPEGKWHQHLV